MSPRQSLAKGFTLVELMVIVAIIGIVSAIGVPTLINVWRRERINALAIDFAGWIELVRAASLREINNNGCTITINALTSSSAGTALASVAPPCQVPEPDFRIPGLASNDRYSSTTTSTAVTFTPRGSTTSTTDTIINLSLDNGSPMRCVRISATLGMIRIGSNNSATGTGGTCTYEGPF